MNFYEMDKLFLLLIILTVIILLFFISYLINYLAGLEKVKKETTANIIIKNNTLDFESLTLRQKIAQMIIIRGDKEKNSYFTNLNIGGIHLDKQKTEEDYGNLIGKYQDNSKIKLFVSTDLEGAWNPLSNIQSFPKFSEIKNKKEAYETGLKQGELLKKIGFNLNFAPVAEFSDEAYGGRAFSGTEEEIKEKLANYIKGLQKNVAGTCKHYPGKGMIKNTHYLPDKENISKEDLELFDTCIKNNISAIMIGHQIVSGEADSAGKPSSVSGEVIGNLEKFDGLVISDEINMLGLRKFYLSNKANMYKDLINSGENVILDFLLTPNSAYKLILEIEKKTEKGEIDETKIDESVKKILTAKGYKIRE